MFIKIAPVELNNSYLIWDYQYIKLIDIKGFKRFYTFCFFDNPR